MAFDISAWQEILPTPKSGPMRWNKDGVWADSKDRTGKTVSRRLTHRPILPTARGVDQDDELWLRVSWQDWRDQERSEWMSDTDARNPKLLEALPGAPVDPTISRQIARWMAVAPPYLTNEERSLATRLGWIGDQFVWPGHLCGREWVGPHIPDAGDLAATTDAVRMIASLPDGKGNLAMVVLGLSAASPLIRWGCTRNPILGLAQSSSLGKSTVFGLALSFWGDPATWSLQGGSTVKGAQDLATQFPDTPILMEDLHKLYADRPEMVQDLLYYMGNGQRRITSSRGQTATGGERRFGVGFFAAEHEILGGSMGGVVFRTWELTGHPMPDGQTARAVAEATQRGRGAAGPRFAAFFSAIPPDRWRRALAQDYCGPAGEAISTARLSAGDVSAVRCLCHGLFALQSVLHLPEIDIAGVVGWLIDQIGTNRATQVDRVKAGWDKLIGSVLGGEWGRLVADRDGITNVLSMSRHDESRLIINGEVIAWRDPDWHPQEQWGQLDINIGSTWVNRILAPYGGERVLYKAWLERGWAVRPNGPHLKHQVRDHGRVAMRVSPEQLVLATGGREDGDDASPSDD